LLLRYYTTKRGGKKNDREGWKIGRLVAGWELHKEKCQITISKSQTISNIQYQNTGQPLLGILEFGELNIVWNLVFGNWNLFFAYMGDFFLLAPGEYGW